jgi:hypothetical protein
MDSSRLFLSMISTAVLLVIGVLAVLVVGQPLIDSLFQLLAVLRS